eukprot:7234064-Pyramimonas_sp.AAC.1
MHQVNKPSMCNGLRGKILGIACTIAVVRTWGSSKHDAVALRLTYYSRPRKSLQAFKITLEKTTDMEVGDSMAACIAAYDYSRIGDSMAAFNDP